MKYYKVRKYTIDYTKEEFNRCWTCQNACGGCSWSREFVPVEGWTATPTHIPTNGEFADSYHITDCPQYAPDRRVKA